MSLRTRINGMSPGASQAFKSIKTSQTSKSNDFDYLGANFMALKSRIQDALLTQVTSPENLSRDELRNLIWNIVEADKEIAPLEKDALVRILVDEILGYGPIQVLLDDPEISEIMINGANNIYIERQGSLVKTNIVFRDEAHLRATLEKMLSFSGRRVDESSPMVDARLPDGSRLNAILRPLAVAGDSITIRKFSKDPFILSQLVQMGTLSAEMATFIEAAVRGKLNIVVSGGTGSGKTTTLNAFSAFIPGTERIVTIEDAAELQLQQDHKVTLEARPPNIEGKGGVAIRDLVRNALRMRPDRIIVGEVRGGEALDMLQAMNTGHEGSLTTVHANSPRDCLSRIETMVLMAGADLPLPAIRSQIASAIDIIVQQARLLDGSRRIIRITEVVGMESGIITTQDLFQFDQSGVDEEGKVIGVFHGNGIRPKNFDRIRAQGVELSPSIFGLGL
ncbi:CpaF family protein [Sulfobacillus sp. hq2]|uniref:Type II secretion system protein E n=1 Tax=Sulfobacillus thermotolerans TaxID=338644 RepID=A0ABM6RU38_9FIRM|nr:CpaF family protein [Sulfobacillus sp. hq2]AUW94785.1 type II secretion system protein E [Sulfobacillus thermotolerans]MCY0907840.1 CpaF family protein [Sulfobacillus thermotolerans]POB09795.1 type II secretion system protein E [Sulfobacillus sp. hq2]